MFNRTEIRRITDHAVTATFYCPGHAKGALDDLDDSEPLTYYAIDDAGNASFGFRTQDLTINHGSDPSSLLH